MAYTMSSTGSLAPVIVTNLLLVLGGCGESPVYTRGAPDDGGATDGPRLVDRGGPPAGIGSGGGASGGIPRAQGMTGAGGNGTRGSGGGPCGSTGGADASGAAPVVGGQAGMGPAGTGGDDRLGGPGGTSAIIGSTGSGGAGGRFGCGGVVPMSPSNGIVSDFASINASGESWTASSGVTGRPFAYHGATASAATAQLGAVAHDLHCNANVGNASYAGCGIVTDICLTALSYTALRFSVSGRSTCLVELQIQTYERKPSTDAPPGGCTASCGNYSSSASLTLTSSPVTVALSTLATWTPASASQIVGVQWQLTNPPGKSSCTADLRFDDIQLVP